MHHTKCTDKATGKPEIVEFYNLTKGGIDALDEKCKNYGVGRRTRRWPMAIFYRMIDIANVNSFILYGLYKYSEGISRFDFMKNVARALVVPRLERRLTLRQVRIDTKQMIRRILNFPRGNYLNLNVTVTNK